MYQKKCTTFTLELSAPFQKTAIREAMTQIQDDVSNCLRFTEYDSRTDMGEDFINISPTEEG